MVKIHKVAFAGWPNCLRLTNGKVELVATTDVGPRVMRFAFVGGPNVFKEYREQLGQTGGNAWRIYGGHRLWHAPEVSPRTYAPDNGPVTYSVTPQGMQLTQDVEAATGIQKQIEITMADDGAVWLVHRLFNRNPWTVELAPWCLTVMAPGGRAVFPQEDYRPHPDHLPPARPLVLWHYTNMADPRWTWGERFIQLRQDPKRKTPQKVGLLNTKGWLAYGLGGQVFLKRYACDPEAPHPDFGCNTETFTNGDMLEVETLGPTTAIPPGACAEHIEEWSLHRVKLPASEKGIATAIGPRV